MGIDKTASSTGLLLGCTYAFRDDVVIPARSAEPNEAMDRGNRVHEAIDKGADLEGPEQGYVLAARAWLDGRTGDKEHAFAWDGYASTHVGFGRAAYAFSPKNTIMNGCADIILDGFDGIRVVADWKTGEHGARKAWPQLMTLAVMTNADSVVAVELREDGTWEEHCVNEVDPWELDAHAQLLRERLAAIPGSEPTPGEHCSEHYCPLRGTCPAYTAAVEHVAELVPANALVRPNGYRPLSAPLVTPEDVAVTLPLLDMIEEWLDATRKRAKAIALENGGEIRLDDATVWKRFEQSKDGVRAKESLALAQKLGASPEELAACTYTTTFDVFRRVRRTA